MPATRHDLLVQEITQTTDGFLKALDDVPEDRWNYTPSAEVWSVGQTAEHTAGVFRGIQRLLQKKLLDNPFPEGVRSPIGDEVIVQSMFNREKRYNAPEFALPTGKWTSREPLVTEFVESRRLMLAWIDGVTEDLRAYFAPHPMIGTMDGVQWLLFAAAHTERHTRQIIEFRRSAGF
ncbi:MAG TPA: DinB family protein [Gemmatimonadales bacterium]|nr:DinB family protein [Gemmatimonadales bacterium]